MQKTLAEIAAFIGGEVVGNGQVRIKGFNSLQEAKEGDLTFVASSKYASLAKTTQASAIIVPLEFVLPGKSIIRTDNPSLAFGQAVSLFFDDNAYRPKGIHTTAVIADGVEIGKNVSIGPCAIIEMGVRLGDGAIIYGGSYVGHYSTLGPLCLIYPHVTIRERTEIGSRVIIHSGTVIGSDGFGYEQIDTVHQKIPQVGIVRIEDDVEIGSNVTIDRARFAKTTIGKGSKIDNLVQIAHNVIVGENCIIISQVGISGSTVLGNNCILAGQAGITGHITLGDGTRVAAQAGVSKSWPPNSVISGYPAREFKETQKINASLKRLPVYIKQIQELKARVEELEAKLKEYDTKTKNH